MSGESHEEAGMNRTTSLDLQTSELKQQAKKANGQQAEHNSSNMESVPVSSGGISEDIFANLHSSTPHFGVMAAAAAAAGEISQSENYRSIYSVCTVINAVDSVPGRCGCL